MYRSFQKGVEGRISTLFLLLLTCTSCYSKAANIGYGAGGDSYLTSYQYGNTGSGAADGARMRKSEKADTYLSGIIDAPTKFRLFLMCRTECTAKCDRLVYMFAPKKTFCHKCIQECLQVIREQAMAIGVTLSDSPVCRRVVNDYGSRKRRKKKKSGGQNKWGMAADQPATDGSTSYGGQGRRGRNRGRGRGRGRKGRGRRRRKNGVGLFKNCILQ